MQTFEEVLTHFHSFLESATYLDVVPCRWGYVRLFNEGDPINFNAILCRTPQELYTALTNDTVKLCQMLCQCAGRVH